MTEFDPRNPYASIDLKRLDKDFAALLRYSAASEQPDAAKARSGEGLTGRERRLFRFGILVGLGEWEIAQSVLFALIDDGLLANADAERAVSEAARIKGLPVCVHLVPQLAARGLQGPGSVAEAVAAINASQASYPNRDEDFDAGLTERETFVLGLGVTWGARCWDT
jgi:hypothetical protein